MSEIPGLSRAQRAYDAMTPREDDDDRPLTRREARAMREQEREDERDCGGDD